METAGMQVVLGADYSGFEQAFMNANALMNQFNTNAIKTATSLKNVFSGINTNISLNFNSDGITGSLNAIIKASDGATESITTIIAQVQNIPSAFAPSVDIVNRLADALAALSGSSGGAIGGNSITAIGDSATRVITEVAGLSGAFTAADASAETFIQESVSLANSLEVNVSILNLYKQQLAQVNEQIKTTQAQHAGTTQAIMAQTGAVDELSAQQAILKQQISQANTVISAQAKEMIANDGSYKSLQNNLSLVSDAYRRLSEEDRNSSIGAGMLQNINQLQTQLKGIDAQMGNFQRNVGNYGASVSQLNFTLQRSFHGLAELFISPSRAVLILANDIPQLINQFRNLNAANQEIVASGGEAATGLSLLKAAFHPLNLAIALGLTYAIKYAPKLYDWATGAEAARAKAKELADQQKAVQQAQDNASRSVGEQIAKVQILEATMTNANLPLKERYAAYDQFSKLYPSYLENVSRDKALTGGLADIINNELVPALVRMGQAQAAQNLLANYNTQLDKIAKKIKDVRTASKSALDSKDLYSDPQVYDTYMAGREDIPGSQINQLKKQFQDVNKDAYDMLDTIKDVMAQTPKLKIDGTDAAADGLKKVKKNADSLLNSENQLYAKLDDIQARLAAGTLSPKEADMERLSAYQQRLQSLFKFNGQETDKNNIIGFMKDIQNSLKDDSLNEAVSKFNDTMKSLNWQIDTKQIDSIDYYKGELTGLKQKLNELGNAGFKIDDNDVRDTISKINRVKDTIDKLQESVKVSEIFTGLNTILESNRQSLEKGWITPLEKAQKDVDALNTTIKQLQKEGGNVNQKDLANVQLKLNVANAQEAQFKFQDDITKIIQTTQDKIGIAQLELKYHLITPKEEASKETDAWKAQLQDSLKTIHDIEKDPLNLILHPNLIFELDKAKKAADKAKSELEKMATIDLANAINEQLQKMAQQSFIDIGEVIGTAIGDKKQLPDLFKNIESQFGEQIENLGESLIAYAIEFQALKNTFFSLFAGSPALAVVAGLGIVALGAAIKAAANKKTNQTKFADGGVVYGPTNALIGEYAGARNNPEVVAPLNKLQSIIGQNQGFNRIQVEVIGKIANDHIYLANKRASQAKNR